MTRPAHIPTPADLIRDEAELLAAGAKLQSQGLELLLAEVMRVQSPLLRGRGSRRGSVRPRRREAVQAIRRSKHFL